MQRSQSDDLYDNQEGVESDPVESQIASHHEIDEMSGKEYANIDAKTKESITKYILTFAKQ